MQLSFIFILLIIVLIMFIINNIPLIEGKKKKKKKKKKKGPGIPNIMDLFNETPERKELEVQEQETSISGFTSLFEGFDYEYASKIKTPKEVGIKKKGDIMKNIEKQTQYMNVIFGGTQQNVENGTTLGSKYFYNTTFKCEDENTGEKVDRYMYYDNKPPGSEAGLLEGVNYSASQIDPSEFKSVFAQAPEPKCRQITMQTRDNDHVEKEETQYVSLYDISLLNPCSFSNGENPISACKCGVECEPSEFSIDLGKVFSNATSPFK